jgi:hypothetical protein
VPSEPPPDSTTGIGPRPPRRVHSINFEPTTDDWLESLVELLRRAGLPRAGRSEVVRVALDELQRKLATQSPADTMTYFLDRDVEWRRARIEPPETEGST